MQIKGCATGRHSDIKPGNNVALGGSHVRGQTASDPKLKKIEDFNAGKSDEKPLDLLKRALVGIGCSAEDFDNAKAKLAEKFKDDEKEITAEFCAEIGFGLHNLIGTTQPATGAPDPYGGPPQFKPPPNFAP